MRKEELSEGSLVMRLMGYLAPYKLGLAVSILCLLVAKGIDAAVPFYIAHIANDFLSQSDQLHWSENILPQCLFLLFALLVSYLLEMIIVVLKNWMGQQALLKIRTDVYEHMLKLPLSFFDHQSVGKLMTRTIHDVDQVQQMFTESVVPLLGNLLLFGGILIGITLLDYRLAIAIMVVLPLVLWVTQRFRLSQRAAYERIRSIVSKMNTFIQEHLMGASTVHHFGLHEQEQKRFEEINNRHARAFLATVRHFSFFISAIDFLQVLALTLVFVLLVALGSGQFQAGTYFAFSLYVTMFFRPLADLAERYNMLQAAVAAAHRIFAILDTHVEPSGPQPGRPLARIDSIEFRDVWFAYDQEHWILKGMSFAIKKGESVAVVGTTGAGKTTILNLLLRFYEYQKGSIRINGFDLREYAVADLRKQFSIVLQDPVIFSGTIGENISLYDKSISQKTIDDAIAYVELTPFLKKDHYLSERGKSLSAGEMQLISLARAIAHKREIIILDEATANIDSETEQKIQRALERILKEKTAVVIAHRLSTIREASKILVIHEGVIAEEGPHEQLLAARGIYEKFYRLQFEI